MLVHWMRLMSLVGVLVVVGHGGLSAQAKDPLEPRVPSDQWAEAVRLTSPVNVTEDIIAQGKDLFEGQGTCLNCHGKSGKGDGPVAKILDPAPSDLTNCAFQKKRSDGELFWVIKNGSPGTGMVSFVPGIIDEEKAWKIIAYVRSFCR